jgi:hypothetical protein
LIDAKRNVLAHGVSNDEGVGSVRADAADYERDPYRRPIDLDRDRFEPRGGQLAPWPGDRAVLYWWRHRPGSVWWHVAPISIEADGHGAAPAAFGEAVRKATATNPPADPHNLAGMEVDFDHYLRRSSSIEQVTVTTCPDPARQLIAPCLASPSASSQRVAVEVEGVWLAICDTGIGRLTWCV